MLDSTVVRRRALGCECGGITRYVSAVVIRCKGGPCSKPPPKRPGDRLSLQQAAVPAHRSTAASSSAVGRRGPRRSKMRRPWSRAGRISAAAVQGIDWCCCAPAANWTPCVVTSLPCAPRASAPRLHCHPSQSVIVTSVTVTPGVFPDHLLCDQVIRENPASRGTEASAEELVGPPLGAGGWSRTPVNISGTGVIYPCTPDGGPMGHSARSTVPPPYLNCMIV